MTDTQLRMSKPNPCDLLKKMGGIVAAMSATALMSYPVLGLPRYPASIFTPSLLGPTRTVDGTIAGEFESAIKYYQDFEQFAQAVEEAGLSENFREKDAQQSDKVLFTVLTPTNEALAALPAGTWEKLLQPENKEQLIQFLQAHVVRGTITPEAVEAGEVETLAGTQVKLQVNEAGDRITLNDTSVVQSSRRAENGVILLIDRVLVSPDLSEKTTVSP